MSETLLGENRVYSSVSNLKGLLAIDTTISY